MAYNSTESAKRYSGELDKVIEQKSVTGFFADNTLKAQFIGAKDVVISDMDFLGLADYDRDTGFTKGPIVINKETYTLTQDRGRSLEIDREDADETGVDGLAGKVLGEYVRTKVIPECDAYVLSKLGGVATARGNVVDRGTEYPYKNFVELLQGVQEKAGYDEELVAFVSSPIYFSLMNSAEISKYITVSDFKQGELNIKVNTINGVPLIPVQTSRMFAQYSFIEGNKGTDETSSVGATGGFVPNSTGKSIFMLVMPKRAASLVRKTEKMRIFTPDENQDKDAWKFDYRVYYDVFVKKSFLDTIWAWFSPTITFATDLAKTKSLTAGSISGNTTAVSASASNNGAISYQYYICDDKNKTNARKCNWLNNRTASMAYDTNLSAGVYYIFCRASADGLTYNDSSVQTITVS